MDGLRQPLKCGENAPMKLATYNDGSRDGQLMVVSRDLSQAHFVSHVVNRLQAVLDDWNYLAPQLQDVSDALNAGRARHPFPFDPAQCMAPLPRAYHWVQGTGYASHQDVLLRAAGGVGRLPGQHVAPHFRQGAGDGFLGAHGAVQCASTGWGIDFAAQLAVVTADLPQGANAERALDSVRLLMLANAWHWRSIEAGEQQVLTAFSPVAVTPDELGAAWSRGRVQLPLVCSWNGRKVGMCEAGSDMTHHFGQLIAELASTRALGAGCIVGSGAVSNVGVEKKGQLSWPRGYNSIVEKRGMEMLQDGQAVTAYMQHGDTIHIDMKNGSNQSIFGAISQQVDVRNHAPAVLPAA